MTCYDVLQGSAYPIHMTWDGLGGNVFSCFEVDYRDKLGADRGALEVLISQYT